ncbi:MAG: MotA/TolQ/ExbB proton channel family protein [Phycisphaerales bacterium]|nr:MotA/TolQ/ExbB proton channel family protein [Phycisphaerales bacterium]
MNNTDLLSSTADAARIFFLSSSTLPDGSQQIEWVGSVMIWVLIAMSIFSIGLIAVALMAHRRAVIMPPATADAFLRASTSQGTNGARAVAAASGSDFARIALAAIDTLPLGRRGAVDAAEQTAEECAARRFRSIELLNVLAQVSPMIGLFGTVYGMIVAFQTVSATGGQADPALLAGGIGTALVTTFWGLFIAIPALLTYATVRNWIDALIAEALEVSLRATANISAHNSSASRDATQ